MSTEKLTISPNKAMPETLDYSALRQLGLSYIESLGSDFWTDYNSHDPGITALEVLCYALSELGYRMQFPMKDLLKPGPSESVLENTLFTARDILTVNPVTEVDFRKILIDQPGIVNAWLSQVENLTPSLYADCKAKELTYDATDHKLNIRGVWDVLLELETNDEFGNLNANGFEFVIPNGILKGRTVEFVVHKRPDVGWYKTLYSELNEVTISEWAKTSNTSWEGTITYTFTVDGSLYKYDLPFTLYSRGWQEENPDTALKNALKKTEGSSLQQFYILRERAVVDILKRVETLLHENRNLCEDYRKIGLVDAEEISFCADIEAAPQADLEDLEAKIVLAIEEYLSPIVPFYSLKELIDSGTPTENIFNGPKLDHGFIKSEDVLASGLRKNVYASDVINLILDIDGIESVSNFVMSKFNSKGKLAVKAEKWAITVSNNHKPRYASTKSKWIFLKNRIPFSTRNSEVKDILALLKAEKARTKLLNQILDLSIPDGQYRELDQFFTIQNDFPLAYGIGEEGLPANATLERKNQARQLQGFLQFFDQLLGNFLAQVERYKQYISLDDTVKHTYYSKFLANQPGGDDLYKDASALESTLPNLAEDEETFNSRRNEVLDHLLSRFQESFNNYVLLLYRADGDKKANEELIKDKIAFLKDYPAISSKRFNAINTQNAGSWPYTQSAGLKQRVLRLAGVNNIDENWLMPIRLKLKQEGAPADDKWSVYWVDRIDDSNLFKSSKIITGKEQAQLLTRKAFQKFIEGGSISKKAGAKYRAVFGKDEFEFASTSLFATPEEAKSYADVWLEKLNTQSEGMNLIEHLLLRPQSKSYILMDACIPDNCAFCGEEDPYSFRLSMVLPYWPTRFRNMHYRRHLEELVHTECPAHLLPKVCWADPFAWQELEDAWNNWLQARQKQRQDRFEETTARLIRALEDVETVYPEAVLHDCEDDKDENPVILNQTRLGIF